MRSRARGCWASIPALSALTVPLANCPSRTCLRAACAEATSAQRLAFSAQLKDAIAEQPGELITTPAFRLSCATMLGRMSPGMSVKDFVELFLKFHSPGTCGVPTSHDLDEDMEMVGSEFGAFLEGAECGHNFAEEAETRASTHSIPSSSPTRLLNSTLSHPPPPLPRSSIVRFKASNSLPAPPPSCCSHASSTASAPTA